MRALAQSLSTSYGAFTRLIPAVNASIAAAAAAVAEPADEGRRRLEGRLKLFCLVEKQVQGDGACQFRALSDQLYRYGAAAAAVAWALCGAGGALTLGQSRISLCTHPAALSPCPLVQHA